MQDTIQKLVMLDRQARQQVEQIHESTGRQKESIIQNKDAIYQQYLHRAERRIAIIRESALKEEEKQEAIACEKYRLSVQTLDEYYASHKERWVHEILIRVLTGCDHG